MKKAQTKKLLVIIGLVLVGVLALVAIYFWLGSMWIREQARQAGVIDPSSPYTEIIRGSGSSGTLKVTVLGDSTAIGTGASGRQQTFSYRAIRDSLLPVYGSVIYNNRAVSGATIMDMLEKQVPVALADRADLILISIGANDVTGLTNADDFRARLKLALDRLLQTPGSRVVLLGVPAVYSSPLLPPLFPETLDIFTRRLIQAETGLLAQYDPARVLAVDIYNSTGPLFKAHPEYFAADKYHPNDRGYAIWAAEVSKKLAALVKTSLPGLSGILL